MTAPATDTAKSPTAGLWYRIREIGWAVFHPIGFSGRRSVEKTGGEAAPFLVKLILALTLLALLLWIMAPATIGLAEAIRLSFTSGLGSVEGFVSMYFPDMLLSGWAYVASIWNESLRALAISVAAVYAAIWFWAVFCAKARE